MKWLLSQKLIIFFSLIAFFSPFFFIGYESAHAQSLLDLPGSKPLSVTVSPQYPRPGQQVTITLESYKADLDRSTITWVVNGIKASSGIAQSKFSFIAGPSGSTQKVDITVTTVAGGELTETVSIHPIDIDIIWQAQSYTPPFYKGKALAPIQADITAVAMPHLIQNGKELNPSDLIYSWKKDDKVLQDQSGYGKQSLVISGGFGTKAMTLSVTVSSRDSQVTGVGQIQVTSISPKVLLYENSLLYGPLYNAAIDSSLDLHSQELQLRAEPYFFSTSNMHVVNPLSFIWKINGLDADEKGNIITLRQPNEKGLSVITSEAINSTKLFQKATKNITVNFNH